MTPITSCSRRYIKLPIGHFDKPYFRGTAYIVVTGSCLTSVKKATFFQTIVPISL